MHPTFMEWKKDLDERRARLAEAHLPKIEHIDKVVRLGTTDLGYDDRHKYASVYAHITYRDGKLSISGVEGPLPNGNCLGGCGQIVMSRSRIINLAPGWTSEMVEWFYDIWDRYHLNDMKIGCEHQEALGWKYDNHRDATTFHGQECLICGYSIGSTWKTESVPQWALRWLVSLPETDKTPAWV